MRRLFTIIALFVGLLYGSTASAQLLATDERPELISASTSTSSAIVAGIIMLTVVNTKKDPTVMQRYLRENEPAVRAALAIGGGDAIADLAEFFDIAESGHARFAKMLRRHRALLLTAAYERRDAHEFTKLVDAALTYDWAIARR